MGRRRSGDPLWVGAMTQGTDAGAWSRRRARPGRDPALPQARKSPRVGAGALGFDVAATYFSTYVAGSIIGPPELNGRVRDGNGCGLRGKAATKGVYEG